MCLPQTLNLVLVCESVSLPSGTTRSNSAAPWLRATTIRAGQLNATLQASHGWASSHPTRATRASSAPAVACAQTRSAASRARKLPPWRQADGQGRKAGIRRPSERPSLRSMRQSQRGNRIFDCMHTVVAERKGEEWVNRMRPCSRAMHAWHERCRKTNGIIFPKNSCRINQL
jgi:hypothetical protein